MRGRRAAVAPSEFFTASGCLVVETMNGLGRDLGMQVENVWRWYMIALWWWKAAGAGGWRGRDADECTAVWRFEFPTPCFSGMFVANSRRHHQDGRMPTEVVAETDRPMRSSVLWQSEQGTHSEEGKVLACSVRRRLTWFRQKRCRFRRRESVTKLNADRFLFLRRLQSEEHSSPSSCPDFIIQIGWHVPRYWLARGFISVP
jgi:hypothetical protein